MNSFCLTILEAVILPKAQWHVSPNELSFIQDTIDDFLEVHLPKYSVFELTSSHLFRVHGESHGLKWEALVEITAPFEAYKGLTVCIHDNCRPFAARETKEASWSIRYVLSTLDKRSAKIRWDSNLTITWRSGFNLL